MKKTIRSALVIPIYNRPQYVAKCFDSLRKLTTLPQEIVLVNDGSADKELIPIIAKFSSEIGKSCTVLTNDSNKGVRLSLIKGIEFLLLQKPNIYYIITLDSDAIVKPDFIEQLTKLHYEVGAHERIVSGFNNPNNKVLRSGSGFNVTEYANGINICFNANQYHSFVKPALQKVGNWDQELSLMLQKEKKHFYITSPSVVQHIGMVSSMGHNHQEPDRADDFKPLSLPDVTLFGIDGHDKAGIIRAAEISQRDVEFGGVKIITDDLFTKGGTAQQRREDYSRFIIRELDKHFSTSHVLIIHADGYVLNWEAWDNDWLQYDYIGATWLYKDGKNVGNGGFSLRSKKLQHILATADMEYIHPEDHHICRTYRKSLESLGIKFAPEEVANKFSIEAYASAAIPGGNLYSGQFGFHSAHVDFSNHLDYNIPKSILYKRK